MLEKTASPPESCHTDPEPAANLEVKPEAQGESSGENTCGGVGVGEWGEKTESGVAEVAHFSLKRGKNTWRRGGERERNTDPL